MNGGESERSASVFAYKDIFFKHFPAYIAMGMSSEEYWDGDPQLAKCYREAEKLKTDKLNQQLWLQGMYVYDAICKASPILHAFAKQGTKALPYPDHPYPLTQREAQEREMDEKEKQMLEAKKYMEQFALRYQTSGGD